MAKTKSELLEEAKKLGLEVSTKNTVAEITTAIKSANKEDKKVAKDVEPATEKTVAKSGKRSAKAIAETEEKLAKEERKASSGADEQPKPKKVIKPARPRIERRGKAYKEAAKLIDKNKEYSLKEAVDLLIATAGKKFDSTAELHVRLGVDPKHADQNIRDSIVLPAGTGKTLKIAIFADDTALEKAGKIDADLIGEEAVTNKLAKEEIDFDILIATPNMMQKLAKFAKLLGPKGLMPNPKSGTVTNDIVKAVKEAKAGRVEYRVDSTGIVHLAFGKVSFGAEKLNQNVTAVFESIKSNKPNSVKGVYVRSIYLTTTMGPSVRVISSEI